MSKAGWESIGCSHAPLAQQPVTASLGELLEEGGTCHTRNEAATLCNKHNVASWLHCQVNEKHLLITYVYISITVFVCCLYYWSMDNRKIPAWCFTFSHQMEKKILCSIQWRHALLNTEKQNSVQEGFWGLVWSISLMNLTLKFYSLSSFFFIFFSSKQVIAC